MKRTLDCYYPGKAFPSVSTTGQACSLSCKHCAGRYLGNMVPVTHPDELVTFARSLADSGGAGFLLSGGCDSEGRVRLGRFAPAIREIKATTPLRVNAHVGLSPQSELGSLVDSGIDAFSVDVYGDDETIAEVLGIRARAGDYISVVQDLMDLGANVAPHVCVGIRGGKTGHEHAAIDMVSRLSPETLVLISFIPSKGTAFETAAPPRGEEVVSVISYARSALPDTRLVLGCMRSKKDRSWEIDAVLAGLDGIVLPSEETVRAAAAMGLTIRSRETCCALG